MAELEGSNGIVYYNYDHLGSVRVVYEPTSNCSGSAVIYKLDNMSDYYAFGKTLRTFGGDKHGYQGSEKNKELGDNDYYTHFRGLDVEVARWKGVDPKWNQSESPYTSMGNNPIMNNDFLGDTIVINLFGSFDLPIFHQAAKNAVLNQVNDGIFLIFGHGRGDAIQYEGKDGKPNAVITAKEFNSLVSEKSVEYKEAIEEKKEIIIKLITCNSASNSYYSHDGVVKDYPKTIAQQISKKNGNAIVIAPNGYVNYGVQNGKAQTIGIRQTSAKEHENTYKGSWITLKNGKTLGKQLEVFKDKFTPPITGPYKKQYDEKSSIDRFITELFVRVPT